MGVAAEFDTLGDVVRIESEVDAIDDLIVNLRDKDGFCSKRRAVIRR